MNLIEKDAKFLRDNLDVLFIALNPPLQSNNNGHYFSNNGHYFSGRRSSFFKQLYLSGLIVENIDKSIADDLIFGENKYNYKNKEFGVIDLKPLVTETNSNKVKVKKEDTELLISRIKRYKPKNVCIIHSDVMKHFRKATGIKLIYGYNGKVLEDLDTEFYCNYFPNGNNIKTEQKVKIYVELKNSL
jgi:hypothetical protein